VWKVEHRDRDVAVKVLRVYTTSDLRKVARVSCGQFYLPLVTVLTKVCIEVLQRSYDVEDPSAPKCVVVDRSNND